MNRQGAEPPERSANRPKTDANYDNGFRQEAVNLLLSSGRALKRVAADLGVSANSLRTWRDRALGGPAERYALIDTMREDYNITEWTASPPGCSIWSPVGRISPAPCVSDTS